MAEDYPGQDEGISASNYSIYSQTGSYRGRPPMQQIDHPAHSVPQPTENYNGEVLNAMRYNTDLNAMSDMSANRGRGPSRINATDK